MKTPTFLLKGILFTVSMSALPLIASSEEEKKKEELPQTGTIASSGSSKGPSQRASWDSPVLEGESESPLSASVSRGAGGWLLKVFNNAQTPASASVEVIQRSMNQQVLKRDAATFSLPPKGSAERTYAAAANATDASVELKGWKGGEKKKDESAAAEEKPAG